MSSLPSSLPSFGEIMTCQGELGRETDDKISDTHSSCDTRKLETSVSHPLNSDPGDSHALHTLVDMALALEEKTSRRTDHTYALKNQIRKLPTEDTDNVSKEKDHTYASNTIGFRYSNHRGSNAQPRKSASEESLVIKPASDSSARKSASTEKFESLSQQQGVVLNDDHLYSFGSNAATLPRAKNKSFPRTAISIEEHFVPPSTIGDTVTIAGNENQTETVMEVQPASQKAIETHATISTEQHFAVPGHVNDTERSALISMTGHENQTETVMEVQPVPRKTDHTYAKFGMCAKSKFFIPHDAFSILSSNAKIEDLHLDLTSTSGSLDHTYDKFSSPKLKDLQDKFNAYKSFVLSSRNSPVPQEVEIDVPVVNCVQHPGGSDMDWQQPDHGQIFEKHFLPSDHTYTTVA